MCVYYMDKGGQPVHVISIIEYFVVVDATGYK
jgi:hypothetical protein